MKKLIGKAIEHLGKLEGEISIMVYQKFGKDRKNYDEVSQKLMELRSWIDALEPEQGEDKL